MEQREEEKNEDTPRKRRKTSSPSFIPVDVTSEIFLRLPAKSVARFRSVSKLWSSITTAPYFTNSFETRPNLLFFFKEDNRFFVVTIPHPQNNRIPKESYSYSSSQILDSYYTTYPKSVCFTIKTESVHGLICFQRGTKPILWNPTMRNFLPLPKPDKSWETLTIFLGYDPVEGKHKLVSMQSDRVSDECRVLTVESGEKSWRTVKNNYKHRPCRGIRKDNYGPCRCIDGVLYYRAEIGPNKIIMSFDVKSEKFHTITLPWRGGFEPTMMVSYKGKLAYLGCHSYENSLLMWVLEDAEKSEWSSHSFLPISHYDRGAENNFKLIGTTNDGELIYVPNTVFESFDVVYIDPVRETFRRVKYKGVADKEFRQRNGLGADKAFRGVQYSPNHIETLMSL
ncbi:PREDICTED: F-box protein At1g48060-like [Camelina sativa]|uniref:F-box protein At1g48060-like n=1 Tax=Camelina sativa TaxID=90675 RepID=A0ABM0YJE5_CAMSA|nr:PREDICTED: F-box protein At1g48060-like [Camelina sativa]